MIQERALKVPETSEELQDMVTFVEQARTVGMIQLNERIKVWGGGGMGQENERESGRWREGRGERERERERERESCRTW